MRRIGHVIGGAETGGFDRVLPVFNPATGEQTGELGLASPAEVDQAVAAAKSGFAEWRDSTLARRTQVMFAFRALVAEHSQQIAAAITAEHGKVLSDAAGEVARGLECIEYACGLSELLKGGYSQQASTGVDVYEMKQPLGVVAGITPFNFPAMVPLWMIPNALACGNAFILKPSEKDPSASLLIADLLRQAGLPDGVFNVVQGDVEAVNALLDHPDVAAVSFVGSTPIARAIYQRGTASGKRVQALGGAKNHMIALPDADIDMVADAAISAGFGSAGERCMAVSEVVALGQTADPLMEAIEKRMAALRIGPGTDPTSEMGPLVTAEHRDKVASYLDIATGEGATVAVDGRERRFDSEGFFLGASLLDNVRPDMQVYTDEIFGPVLGMIRVDDAQQAVDLINANPYGNGAAIFTRDGGAARQFAAEVEAGMVGINVPIPVPVSHYSFGGWGDSLFGDSHVYGPEGVHFYTRTKVVTSRWPDPSTSGINLGFPTHD